MFSRDRADSNIHEIGALLLTASLAMTGCERREDASASQYQPPSHSTTYDPKSSEVAALPPADHGKVIDYESFEKLERSMLSVESMMYHAAIRDRMANLLDEIVQLDKKPGGLEKSGKKEQYGDLLAALTDESEKAEKSAPSLKVADDMNAFKLGARVNLRVLFAVISLAGKTNPGWERENIPDGTLSEAGKMCEEVRDACRKSARDARESVREFLPANGHQPQMTFALELADAVAAANRGLLSVSSKEFIVAPLPETGMDYVILSMSPVENPTPETWQGHVYILGGAKRANGGISRMDINYPSRAVYVRMDDNNLLRVEQRGAQLYFSKNSAGYAQASGELTILGTGAAADVPLSNVYARVNYLEALAYIDGNWRRIYDGIIEQQKSGKRTIDPALVQKSLEPLVTDKAPDSPPSTVNQFVTVNFGDLIQVLPPIDPVPVYMRLKDSTLLKITAHRSDVHFYRTSAGYAVAGGKLAIAGVVTAGADVPVSNLYTEITTAEALAYFDNDWHPIYDAVARQARALPNALWPNVALHEIAPSAPQPSMYGVSFQGAKAPEIGAQ